jgi:hypothetical protein
MEYIRLLHPNDYDRVRGRFISLAFKNSSDGGISVIQCDCVAGTGNGICAHTRIHYRSRIDPEFIIFWRFDESILPPPSRLEQTPGGDNNDDQCHYDIFDLSKSAARTMITTLSPTDTWICRNGQYSKVTGEDLQRMIAAGLTNPRDTR